jgi:hypothetical protein
MIFCEYIFNFYMSFIDIIKDLQIESIKTLNEYGGF